MLTNKVGAIVFYVKDMQRSEKFYRDVLGLKTQLNAGHGGEGEAHDPWMIAHAANLSLIFFQRDEPIGRSPIVVFTLDEGGIDDVVEQLTARGAQIVTPVSEAPGGWTADFVDPDRHMLSLYQRESVPRKMTR
jgi:predicted enzyme related to lactoylglutathione lyase